jgi:hypothetical protein
MRNAIFAASVGMTIVGCAAKPQAASHAARPAPPAVASATDASKNKVIVHVVNHRQTITVTSSAGGLLYSLKDASGNVMIADASEQKFAELQPALYRNIKNYIAVHADDAPAVPADAGMDEVPIQVIHDARR